MLDEKSTYPMHLLPLDRDLEVDVRSFFVFFRDGELGRRILAGVDMQNVTANNYFDGPFRSAAGATSS